jgi:hypothetical protein
MPRDRVIAITVKCNINATARDDAIIATESAKALRCRRADELIVMRRPIDH